MIYVHPGVPSFAIVVSPDGLVVDGPRWTRPNGAGDLGRSATCKTNCSKAGLMCSAERRGSAIIFRMNLFTSSRSCYATWKYSKIISLHEKTSLQIFTLVVKVSKGIIKIRLNFTLTLLNVKLLFTLHLLQYKETDYLYLSLRLNQR